MKKLKIKPTPAAIADFNFYVKCPLDMIGKEITIKSPTTEEEMHRSIDALSCFYALDTFGKEYPCHEPELLAKALRTKKSVNLQIKMWAESFNDWTLQQEELLEYLVGWPSWVFEAVLNQAGKLLTQSQGYCPRWARVERLFGNVWLPRMDDFDPAI